MKHMTFGDKSLLVGDAVADLVMEYAALLARNGDADTVDVHAYGGDGAEVTATLLLETGSPLMVETTHTTMPEPDNDAAASYIRNQVKVRGPIRIRPHDGEPATYTEDPDFSNLPWTDR